MAKRAVEHPPFAVPLRPSHWHHHIAETGGGQNRVAGVHVHVVVLRGHGEVFEALGDGAGHIGDIDLVGDPIAPWVGHPLAANHVLVFWLVTERISHAPMHPRDPRAVAHRLQQRVQLIRFDVPHRPDGDDQVQPLQVFLFEDI